MLRRILDWADDCAADGVDLGLLALSHLGMSLVCVGLAPTVLFTRKVWRVYEWARRHLEV